MSSDTGLDILQEKASELAILKTAIKNVESSDLDKLQELEKLVAELAEDNGFSLPGKGNDIFDDVYTDWYNSSCYGESHGRTFGVYDDGSIWEPSSC